MPAERHRPDAIPSMQQDMEKDHVHNLKPGSIVTDKKTYFQIASTDGFVKVLSLQLAGKKRMEVADFLRGYRHVEDSFVE